MGGWPARDAMWVVPFRIDVVANIAVGLLVASALSMIVRPVTAELNDILGTVWPFSTIHCENRAVPGCEPDLHAAGALGDRHRLAVR
jgi:hypothetical protein